MKKTAIVIHPEVRILPTSRNSDALLNEACGLAEAIDLEVIHGEVVKLFSPKAGRYFGAGFLELLVERVELEEPHPVIIIDCSLSPVQ